MSPKQKAVLFAVIFMVVFYHVSGFIYNFAIGITLPIFGFIGVKPFEGLAQFNLVFLAAIGLLTYFVVSRRKQQP